jgi:KaiC/GvpD/RAD55 family RecA-like ATPase
MADLIVGKTNISKLLREKYAKLGDGWVTLLKVPNTEHFSINVETLRILIKELNYTCVYITLGKSFNELDKSFKSEGIPSEGLLYIDAISNLYGPQTNTKRCKYASGPLDIESISSALRELLSTIPAKKKCVFLDSVTAVLLYNSLSRTVRFSKFLTDTLKKIGVDGVMVSISKGDHTDSLIQELSKLCNEVIDIKS